MNASRHTISEHPSPTEKSAALASWRLTGIGILRIVFGLVWAVDAWFKWQPDFTGNFSDYLTGALKDQPAAVKAWIDLWINPTSAVSAAEDFSVSFAARFRGPTGVLWAVSEGFRG